MAFPAVHITDTVLYYPQGFDTLIGGPFAAIITEIDLPGETISVTVFPPRAFPVARTGIQYMPDVDADLSFFALTSDAAPACGAEVTGFSITDFTSYNFVLEWTRPANSAAVMVFYKVTGGPDWLTPNNPGNKTGEIETDMTAFIFTNLDDAVSYDFLIVNICKNGISSAGETLTGTAITPP